MPLGSTGQRAPRVGGHGQRDGGYLSISIAGGAGSQTLLTSETGGLQAEQATIRLTGAITGNRTVVFPIGSQEVGLRYLIQNATSGAFSVTIQGSVGTGVTLTQGKQAWFLWNGADFEKVSLESPGPLAVADGGTGATTAAGARTSLGAAASGANSDITSITGLSTPLAVNQGGTAATSAGAARTSLGAAASGANADITSLTGITGGIAMAGDLQVNGAYTGNDAAPRDGVASIDMADDNQTPAAGVYEKPQLELTGALTAQRNLILPAVAGSRWIIDNQCSGAFSVLVKTAAGAGVAIANGMAAVVRGDGTDIRRVTPDVDPT